MQKSDLPKYVYENLPIVLKAYLEVKENGNEKDMENCV